MELEIWMMKRKDVCKAYGTSSAGLHRGMIDGTYAKPYRTSERSVRWRSDEVLESIKKLQIAVPVEVAPGSKRGRKPKNPVAA